jgi:uncharacterized protein (TIRG00374 family)
VKNKQTLLGLLFSLAVIGYVLVKLDWQAVVHTFTTLNWAWLVIAFGVYLINYVMRTRRFQILLNLDRLPFYQLYGITNLYGMYLYLMPAKSGELSYPILLKNNLNVSLTTSTATLIAARYFDFATIALFLPPVLLFYWQQIPPWLQASGFVFSGLVVLAGVAARWLLRRSSPNTRQQEGVEPPWRARLIGIFQGLITSLRAIDRRQSYWRLWLLTIGIWLSVQTNFYLIILSLGYQLSFFQVVLVSIIMVPMTLLPLQGFANLGTHEIGWVAAFTLFNQSQAVSLNVAVSSHIILLLFVLLLGAIGYLLTWRKPLRSRTISDI